MKIQSALIAAFLAITTTMAATPEDDRAAIIHPLNPAPTPKATTPNGKPNKDDKGRHDEHEHEPVLGGFNYNLNRNYTADPGYERIEISLSNAAFSRQVGGVDISYDAKGTIYATKETQVFVPYEPDWFLVHTWDPGYWPNGFLHVEMYTRLDPHDCTLYVRFDLSGRGAVFRKLHESIGPDAIEDEPLRQGLHELGVCGGH